MKPLRTSILFLSLIIGFIAFSGSRPSNLSCASCNQGKATGLAHSELASCISGTQQGTEVSFYTSTNALGGYTVSVFGAPKCHPGQICPLYFFLIGSVIFDADCNVVEANCGFSPI